MQYSFQHSWVFNVTAPFYTGIPSSSTVKYTPAFRNLRRCRLDSRIGKIPCRTAWPPTPVFLPGESHGQRNLTGYSPWRLKESDTAEES